MWIRTDDIGWSHDLIWGAIWIGTNSEIMLSWSNVMWYVDWKVSERELSRPIWSNMWIRTDDKGWCHYLIWGDMWIGTDGIIWCHE
jgi:hypothetical protein